MSRAWALVPIKTFTAGKSRLEGLLSRDECTVLAEQMARDVLRALIATPDILGIAIVTAEPQLPSFAEAQGARLIPEPVGGDLSAAIAKAAVDLEQAGARQLLVLPADLPTVSGSDIQKLLDGNNGGVVVCPASRDGGTNGLLVTPPTAIPFLFGADSARRHLAAASAAGIAAQRLELPAFARDIDTPEDVEWLLEQRLACATIAWLKASGIRDRLKKNSAASTAPTQTGK